MTRESSEGERSALKRLLEASSKLVGSFSADVDAELRPIVAEVLAESGLLLTEVIESFGWNGVQFTRPVDVQKLISRLKALVYDGLELMGRGTFASVYKARNRLTGDTVTLKKLRLSHIGEGLPAHAIREVSLLAAMDHPNVVRFQDVMWDESRLYIVLEYLDVDLRQHIDTDRNAGSPSNVKLYTYQILQGLHAVHSMRVLHRDLKPQNILVDRSSNTCKIADFGLARTFVPPVGAYTHEVVTRIYRPPELLLGSENYSTPVDIWSVGCILAELATKEALFVGDSEIGQLFQIFKTLGTPDERSWKGVSDLPDWQPQFPKWGPQNLQEVCPNLDPLGVDLLKQILVYDPKKRITARKALQHPYFEDLRKPQQPADPKQQHIIGSGRPASGLERKPLQPVTNSNMAEATCLLASPASLTSD